MKRILLASMAIVLAMLCTLQASPVSVGDAHQVADDFFSSTMPRLSARDGQAMTRLAYKAESERFYVFDRGAHGGFVVVAGDDRLPQVLGYGSQGDFSSAELPSAVRYWLESIDRQIAFLQSHDNVAVHRPAPQATAVGPLMTTQWDQGAPYNNYCPTYDGGTRAVTGCVATAVAQVMNYHEWPLVGTGSHSYLCSVNGGERVELSADFSQSVYRWDLMLDTYDENSSEESCDAVARLMSDVGISVDMGYGSSSGAQETAALASLKTYFGYTTKSYLLSRDYYNADEWDQFLFDELSAGRPIVYCGFDYSATGASGHAFVFDGFDTRGYFHVNWGWGGHYDGYFLASTLAPSAGMDFKYGQDAIIGLVPAPQEDVVDDVLYVRGLMSPVTRTASLGSRVELALEDIGVEGNKLDTAGYEERYGRIIYYANIPMSIAVFDKNGVERQSEHTSYQKPLSGGWYFSNLHEYITLSNSLEDGEYQLRVSYSLDDGVTYDQPVLDFDGNEMYAKMIVSDGVAYLMDCYLSNTYGLESFELPRTIRTNEPFNVNVTLSYDMPWADREGPAGNVYLSLLKDGNEVAVSDMIEVQMPTNTIKTYEMELMAPSEWGRYDLVLNDETGHHMMKIDTWQGAVSDGIQPIFIFPPCEELAEDFESMTANSSTNAKNVQGAFNKWSFNKSGVRAPGEGRCHGLNSVMLKKASTVYTVEPMSHNFFMAQATFFNRLSSMAKYTLEYSLDEGITWQKANTLTGQNAVEVPENSEVVGMWTLPLTVAQPAVFRIAMIAGSTGSTYVDDFVLYYADTVGDVNGDGEVNIADVNAVIDVILAAINQGSADVNGDGEINVNDINFLIDMLIAH